MRPIHTARLDTVRPVLILTRELVRPHLNRVTVAPITSTILGLSTEVPVGSANGLDHVPDNPYRLVLKLSTVGKVLGR